MDFVSWTLSPGGFYVWLLLAAGIAGLAVFKLVASRKVPVEVPPSKNLSAEDYADSVDSFSDVDEALMKARGQASPTQEPEDPSPISDVSPNSPAPPSIPNGQVIDPYTKMIDDALNKARENLMKEMADKISKIQITISLPPAELPKKEPEEPEAPQEEA